MEKHEDIKKIVYDLRKMTTLGSTELDVESLKKKYQNFWETYPMLFRMSLDSSFPMTHLDMMLKMSAQINNKNDITDNDVKKCDEMVYNVLMNEYMPDEMMRQK